MGRAIVQDLDIPARVRVILKKVRLDKQARFLAQSARFKSGEVGSPRGSMSFSRFQMDGMMTKSTRPPSASNI